MSVCYLNYGRASNVCSVSHIGRFYDCLGKYGGCILL